MIRKISSVIHFLSGTWRSLFQKSLFRIKRGYRHRTSAIPHDDRTYKEEYQKEVYMKAAELMKENNWQTVIDIGCGSGYKLMKYLGTFRTTGVDYAININHAKNVYPSGRWLLTEEFNPSAEFADLIICADVLEHVPDPDHLMQSIISINDWKCLMLSTPERNSKRGRFHFGPSPNPSHYREWSMKEFNRFVSDYASIDSQEITHQDQRTQLLICSPRRT